jgi:glycosyltransferase involved in cell wall biosynthesis
LPWIGATALTSSPKVSVLMITHNHERYIEQAVRSVLMQQVDCDFELVIGEDCSTDRTRLIVLGLAREFPDQIRLLLPDRNLGMIQNLIATYQSCKGRYIALCEGDDYWTSPGKLQLQLDYMDQHPECRLCFHNARIVDEAGIESLGSVRPPSAARVGLAEWLLHRSWRGSYIATAATMFRRPDGTLPDWYERLRFAGDWPLFLWLLLQGGELAHIDANLSVYRRHAGSVTQATSSSDMSRKLAALNADLEDHELVMGKLEARVGRLLRPRIGFLHYRLLGEHLAAGQVDLAKKHLWLCVSASAAHAWRIRRELLRCLLELHFPPVFRLVMRFRRSVR